MLNNLTVPQVQARTLTGDKQLSCGYLLWWTIHQRVYNYQAVSTSALTNKVPGEIYDMLVGDEAVSAWHKATKIDNGIVSLEPDADCKSRYVTKEVQEKVRLLVREKISKGNRVLSLHQLGVLTFDGGFKFDAYPDFETFKDEATAIIQSMSADYAARIGQLDDIRVRKVMLAWIDARHRVNVRKTGGVYYIPLRAGMDDEITHVAQWLAVNDMGTLSSIAIFETPGTTIQSLIDAATEEITEEVESLTNKLANVVDNFKADIKAKEDGKIDDVTLAMKAGSYTYTVGQYKSQLARLEAKVTAVDGSLGKKLGQFAIRLAMLDNRADQIKLKAESASDDYQTAKATKPATPKKVKTVTVGGVKRKNV